MTILKKIKNKILQILAPENIKCLCCGRDLFDGEVGFCEKCLPNVPFNNGKTCIRCGVAIYGEENYCSHCAFEKNYFEKAYSVFKYEGEVKRLILKMKFYNKAYICNVFAQYLVWMADRQKLRYDVVCYVPMTKKSQRRRGYNQSLLLAEAFCDILQNNSFCHALTKVKETVPQEHLTRKQRKENPVGAFSADKNKVSGKTVLLIDDVKTTGATLNECAKALKKAGATQVNCITVCSREEVFNFESEEEL